MNIAPEQITVAPIAGYPALKMTWPRAVRGHDVSKSFQEINAALNAATRPQYVVVDLLNKPSFPLTETITGAMHGPNNHPMLAGWLIVTSNTVGDFTTSMARIIERTLASLTQRHNVQWFSSEAAALGYMAHAQPPLTAAKLAES
jgi:hypothetical protein